MEDMMGNMMIYIYIDMANNFFSGSDTKFIHWL